MLDVILGVSTIHEMVYEVGGIIVSQLMYRFIQISQTPEDWLEIAAGSWGTMGLSSLYPFGRSYHLTAIVGTHTLDMHINVGKVQYFRNSWHAIVAHWEQMFMIFRHA